MLYFLIIPEENHENPRAIQCECGHSHLTQCYIPTAIWGKSRKSQGFTRTLCSLTFEAMLLVYCLIVREEIHENPRSILDNTVLTHNCSYVILPNSTWEKSCESQFHTWKLCSLTFKPITYNLILPEQNHENPRVVHGICAHYMWSKFILLHSTWGYSRESYGYTWTLPSLTCEA
jgi:hypothetical protein